MDITVHHNREQSCFELPLDGRKAVCCYRQVGQSLLIHHTEVPAALQGRGLAAIVTRATLDWARQEGLQVRPQCSYVAAYMRRHPETQDLLQGR